MNRLIEGYLRAGGRRYFRGHHDDEYFFLVGFLRRKSELKGHLNVHLEVCGTERDAVQVSITADRFYPAGARALLEDLVARCNADAPAVSAVVHDSCDPQLVGLLVSGRCRPSDLAELTQFVDAAVAGAVALFGEASGAATPAQQRPGELRDAG